MSESASTSISAVQLGADSYQYTITLNNTGSTLIGTFWFSWVPGAGYLPDTPNFSAPTGWTAHQTNGSPPQDGYSIQWVANSFATALQPGTSSTFTFTSATPPAVLFGESTIHPPTPVDTAVIYSGAPFSDGGFTFAANSAYQQLFDGGVYAGVDYFFIPTAGQVYSSYEYTYSAGGDYIGAKFFYTGITSQAYKDEEVDYDGGGNVARLAFADVTGASYSSYEYDYVGGVFAGSKFTFTDVPAGATYTSYETDYDQASAFTGDKFFFTGITGQSYTGEEEDFDASGELSRVMITGVSGQGFSSLEEDYNAGTYTGYKADYTGITGQSYTGEEVDVSAAGELQKVVYTGMASTPYSSVEQDYSAGAVTDTVYDFTNVAGATYYADQVEQNVQGQLVQTTFDLNDGGHTIIGAQNGLTIASLGDDKITGGGSGETFVFNALYGHDTITDFAANESSDMISLPMSEFANFGAVQAAATVSGGNLVISAADGDTLTLKGVTALPNSLSADFTFHA